MKQHLHILLHNKRQNRCKINIAIVLPIPLSGLSGPGLSGPGLSVPELPGPGLKGGLTAPEDKRGISG